jgi:hypothetical protein
MKPKPLTIRKGGESPMLTTKQARKLLTKKEQAHLTEVGIHSMEGMLRQVAFMKEQSVCEQCKHIARKLNLWPEGS